MVDHGETEYSQEKENERQWREEVKRDEKDQLMSRNADDGFPSIMEATSYCFTIQTS